MTYFVVVVVVGAAAAAVPLLPENRYSSSSPSLNRCLRPLFAVAADGLRLQIQTRLKMHTDTNLKMNADFSP